MVNRQQLRHIPISAIQILRRNPQYMTPHEMEALKASIERDGFLAPILVRRKAAKYEVLSGNHRAMAAQQVGLKSVPAVVVAMSDAAAARVAVNLNTVHGDPPAELLAPFLAEMDAETLATVHLDEELRKQVCDLDASMADLLARDEVPSEFNADCSTSEIRPCVCPTCGKRHVRAADGGNREAGGIPEGESDSGRGKASGIRRTRQR